MNDVKILYQQYFVKNVNHFTIFVTNATPQFMILSQEKIITGKIYHQSIIIQIKIQVLKDQL